MRSLRLFSVFASLAICFALSRLYVESYFEESLQSPKIVFVSKGGTQKALDDVAKKYSLRLGLLDILYIKKSCELKSGWFDLGEANLSRIDFLDALCSAKPAARYVTLIPGETTEVFLRQLAYEINGSEERLFEAYQKTAPFEEGVLFADSYSLPMNAKEKEAVKILVDASLKRHKRLAEKYFGGYDERQWFQIVTKASIIQKEAANISEMPKIASVIENRLAANMPLQMDGTLNYGAFSHERVTAERIRKDRSDYNTYKFKGLPKNPVCVVQEEAIRAAINPAETDYLYFVKGSDGAHIFSNSYTAHNKNIANVKKSNRN